MIVPSGASGAGWIEQPLLALALPLSLLRARRCFSSQPKRSRLAGI